MLLVPDDLELYDPPPLTEDDIRDWLRQQLVCWPYVTSRMRRFLDGLYWRQRASVTLTMGEGLPQDEVAYKLGVSRQTVGRDVATAIALAEGWAEKDKARESD